MHEKGFAKPKDVWLNNIRAFIDVDLEQEEGLLERVADGSCVSRRCRMVLEEHD